MYIQEHKNRFIESIFWFLIHKCTTTLIIIIQFLEEILISVIGVALQAKISPCDNGIIES